MENINLIIGASSGIGREIVKLQSNEKDILIATFNKNPDNIPNVKNILTIRLDLLNQQSITSFVNYLKNVKGKIKRIFLVGAIPGFQTPDLSFSQKPTIEDMIKFSTANCFSYIKLLSEIINKSMIQEDCKICVLSSLAGSTTLRGKLIHNKPGGNLPYRISKAALNCAVKNIAYDLKEIYPKLIIFSLHPGWVQTFSTGTQPEIKAKDSAFQIFELMNKISASQSGNFYDSLGTPLGF